MDEPEPITQSEVSQKEKITFHILAHTHIESIKMIVMNLYADIEEIWTQQRKERVGQIERVTLKRLHHHR